MCEDSKYIIFPDKFFTDSISIYYKEVAKQDAEAIKIGSDIEHFTANDSTDIVTYLSGSNLNRYRIGKDSK